MKVLKQLFEQRRLVILPQPRGRPWKNLPPSQAFWSVDESIADLPCSGWALSSLYGHGAGGHDEVGVNLHRFFVELLGVPDVLTRETLMQRFRVGVTSSSAQRPRSESSNPSTSDEEDSGSEPDEEAVS